MTRNETISDHGELDGMESHMGKYVGRTLADQFLRVMALSMSFAIAAAGSSSAQSAAANADPKTLVMTDRKCELAVPSAMTLGETQSVPSVGTLWIGAPRVRFDMDFVQVLSAQGGAVVGSITLESAPAGALPGDAVAKFVNGHIKILQDQRPTWQIADLKTSIPNARFVVVTTDTNELQIYGAAESSAQFCAEMIDLPSQDVGLFANLRPLR